ncbi:MAG: ATP-binding protein [Spirochaetales bacterium]|nr:ATP-binding protein [Spirochaetales bacterium]
MKKWLSTILLLLRASLFCQDAEPMVFGIVPTSPPVMFLDEHNTPSGFAVDLFTQILDELDIPYTLKIDDFPGTYYGLVSGEVDIFPTMLYSEERAEILYYPEHPVIISWGALFVGENTLFQGITDITGQTIGVVKEDQNGKNFREFVDNLDLKYQIQEYNTYEELFRNVRLGRIYGGVSSYHHQLSERGIKQTGAVFYPEPVYCVTGREQGNRELIDKISSRIQQLRNNPSSYYYSLEKKWYYPQGENFNPKLMRALIISALLIFLIIIHLSIYNRFLSQKVKREVEAREKDREKQKKVELKNDFLSSISHELRTPMNIISSLVYLLSQTELDENQQQKINQINKASNMLLDIIKNFLDFNRLEKGKVELEERSFSLTEELEEILNLFSGEISSKGLHFERKIDEAVPSFLQGDPYRLSQIITNLLNNAVKFSNEGTITFSVEVAKSDRKDCFLRFSISDQGIGMNREQQEKLFSPFTQADSSISRQFGGSGLGMAICDQLIKLMGGTIEVESREGEGTRISFQLPFEKREDREKEIGSDQKYLNSYKGARILYAEDNKINREIGQELFNIADLEIETAENGLKAVEMSEKTHYDLILMDIQMPFMDGMSATRKIRENEEKCHIPPTPIVALSAHFLEEDIKSAYEAGMDDYLTKPISIKELNLLFNKWLAKYSATQTKRTVKPEKERASIPGIDMDDVMERFGGNYDLLMDSLTSFVNDYALMPAMLISLESQGNITATGEKVHTLKGVLGSLGALDLYRQASILEQKIKETRATAGEVRDFSGALEDFISKLEGNG